MLMPRNRFAYGQWTVLLMSFQETYNSGLRKNRGKAIQSDVVTTKVTSFIHPMKKLPAGFFSARWLSCY